MWRGVSVDRQALIEEARRRARRRRIRNGSAVLLVVGVGLAGYLRFGGQGGGSAGSAAEASGQRSSASTPSALAAGFPVAAETDWVSAFAFDPRAPATVYVAGNRSGGMRRAPEGGVYKTTTNGRQWQVTTPSRWPLVLTLAADPQRPGTVYAGTERAIFKTVDGGRHWRTLSRWPLPYGDYSLTVDPVDSRVVYATSGSGISKSRNGGHTWRTVLRTFGSSGSAFAIARASPEVVYALEGDGGRDSVVVASADGGKTWRPPVLLPAPAPGLAEPGGKSAALAVDPQSPATLYAAVGSAVLKSTDGGRSWRSIAGGLPRNVAVSSLTVDPRHAGTLYAALGDDGIFKTTDGGRTWSQHWFPIISVEMVAIDPARPSTVFAGVTGVNVSAPAGSSPEPRILRSTNNGRTWPPAG